MSTYSFTDDELKTLLKEVTIALIENASAEISASDYEVVVDSIETSLGMEDALQIAVRLGRPELFHVLYSVNHYVSHKGE